MIATSDSTLGSLSRKLPSIHRSFMFVFVVVLIVALVAMRLVERRTESSSSSTRSVHSGKIASGGAFMTTSGHMANLASYIGGRTTMVWFIAGGCASCAASIPAVAKHLHQLNSDGVRVVTLGLYGAFPSGRQGVTQLANFGSAAAGTSMPVPGWTWGMASKTLSMAYDPSGTPDEYFLVAPNGHIVYQNSVPVSTMSQLLAMAARVPRTQTKSSMTKSTLS